MFYVNNVLKEFNIDWSLLREKLEIFNKLVSRTKLTDELIYEKQCEISEQLFMREHDKQFEFATHLCEIMQQLYAAVKYPAVV